MLQGGGTPSQPNIVDPISYFIPTGHFQHLEQMYFLDFIAVLVK